MTSPRPYLLIILLSGALLASACSCAVAPAAPVAPPDLTAPTETVAPAEPEPRVPAPDLRQDFHSF